MNIHDIPETDRPFEDCRVVSVEHADDPEADYYEVGTDGRGSFLLDKEHEVVPRVGDRVRLYGRFGRPIRGVVINDAVAFYRTKEEEAERFRIEVANDKAKRRADYESKRDEYNRRILALPIPFQDRIAAFRAYSDEFNADSLPYELFCCEEAVKIARHCETPEAVQRFQKAPHEGQREVLSDQHSGNTASVAFGLAFLFLNHPDSVPLAHGALCPLVGCKEYGCAAARRQR